MNRAELSKGFRMFALKIALYWLGKLVICQIDDSRLICSVIAKGFGPCVASFAFMDFLVIPWLRRRIQKMRESRNGDRPQPG